MDEFIVIKVMNESMLRLKRDKNIDYTINKKIKELLEDEVLFFRISKRNAINLLNSVGVADDKLEEVYTKLTDKKTYNKLVEEGKINANDKLTIKYN